MDQITKVDSVFHFACLKQVGQRPQAGQALALHSMLSVMMDLQASPLMSLSVCDHIRIEGVRNSPF